MRPRRRDPVFLQMAAVAAAGGVLAIVAAVGFPVWAHLHGRPVTPAFALFAVWGLAALAGAAACVHTYRLSSRPEPPPRGGVALTVIAGGMRRDRAA